MNTNPEEQLRQMIDNIPTLAWSCLPDGTTEFLNKRWLDYTGLTFDESLGWGWRVPIHPEDLGKLTDMWTNVLRSEDPGQEEARIRRFDGEYRWFLFRAVPIRDENQKVVRWYGTNTDIEDLKRAEFLLAAEKRTLEMISSGENLAAILEFLCNTIDSQISGVISAVLLMDPDGERLWPTAGGRVPRGWAKAINPVTIGPSVGSCGTAAYLKKQVITSDIATDPLWECFRDIALENGLRAAWSQPLLSKDGGVLGTFCMYHAEPRIPEPADFRAIEAANHIALIAIEGERSKAALTKAHDEIRKSEAQFRTIVDTIPTMVWSALPNGSVDFLSRRWLEYYGGELEDSTSWRWKDLVHPEDQIGIVKRWQASVDTGQPYEHEFRARTVDGEYRWGLSRAHPLRDDQGRIVKWYGTNTDIEHIKRAEERHQGTRDRFDGSSIRFPSTSPCWAR